MSINIQVAVDKTTSELRAAVEAIRGLSEDTRRSLLEATQLVLEDVNDDPELDMVLFEGLLVMHVLSCIGSGEIVL